MTLLVLLVLLALVAIWLATASAALAIAYRRVLRAAWREPVLRVPVLILESDDWGYGPPKQAERLDRIAALLAGFRDSSGRPPVMTLGVVLAGPDTTSIRADGCLGYHRIALDDPRLARVRDAMLGGVSRGVFALHLHGHEHYWPDCLLRAAQTDARVRDWLTGPEFPATEQLPSTLQSRWIDGAELPTKPLPPEHVGAEAAAEVARFAEVIGTAPAVVVPTTFLWTVDAESAWVRSGVQVVVTPGRRSERRDAAGTFVYTTDECFNGAVGPGGALYIVRDSYFEPYLGHTHQRAIEALRSKSRLGRPTLVEMHRINFISDIEVTDRAFAELRRLLEIACNQFWNIRFMSTAELAAQLREPSDLVDRRLITRVHFLLRRIGENTRLRKLAWLTGVIVPAWLAYVVTRPGSVPFVPQTDH
jgi:hypothetical protein